MSISSEIKAAGSEATNKVSVHAAPGSELLDEKVCFSRQAERCPLAKICEVQRKYLRAADADNIHSIP
jgi:hypothetical protein